MATDVALILTVDTDNYDDALRHAEQLAEGIAQEGENISAVLDYEDDFAAQRVLYLHASPGSVERAVAAAEWGSYLSVTLRDGSERAGFLKFRGEERFALSDDIFSIRYNDVATID